MHLPSINVRNIFVQRRDIEIFQSKLVQQQEDMRPLYAISVCVEKRKIKISQLKMCSICATMMKKIDSTFHSQGHTLRTKLNNKINQ